MNLQEEYGFDAFCSSLVDQWPEVGVAFRRSGNRLFVGVTVLGTTSVVPSRDNELPGSTVRRAVADLHARLVVRSNRADTEALSADERVVLNTVKELAEVRLELNNVRESIQEVVDGLQNLVDGVEDDDGVANRILGLPALRERLLSLESSERTLEAALDDLDPEQQIEESLVDRGVI